MPETDQPWFKPITIDPEDPVYAAMCAKAKAETAANLNPGVSLSEALSEVRDRHDNKPVEDQPWFTPITVDPEDPFYAVIRAKAKAETAANLNPGVSITTALKEGRERHEDEMIAAENAAGDGATTVYVKHTIG